MFTRIITVKRNINGVAKDVVDNTLNVTKNANVENWMILSFSVNAKLGMNLLFWNMS